MNEALQEWDMVDAIGLGTPGVTQSGVSPISGVDTNDEDEEPMDVEDAILYRGTAAKLKYISLGHPQIAFAAKEASRIMSSPTKGDTKMVKRILRYLRTHPLSVYPDKRVG